LPIAAKSAAIESTEHFFGRLGMGDEEEETSSRFSSVTDWLVPLVGNVLLFALIFCMSATVDGRAIRSQIHNARAIFTGVFCQFLLMPFLGFITIKLFQNELSPATGFMLLVITSSPGGSYSNWFCSVFNADLALSVSMTAVSSLLSIVMVPFNLVLYSKFTYEADVLSQIDWKSVGVALLLVMCGIVSGIYASVCFHSRRFQKYTNAIGNLSGAVLILFSAVATNTGSDSADSKIWNRDQSFYLACLIPCISGLLAANIIATVLDLPKPERVAASIESSYQNVGIATSLALTMVRIPSRRSVPSHPFSLSHLTFDSCCFTIVSTKELK
jgi:predicted Na+-dependent transporter